MSAAPHVRLVALHTADAQPEKEDGLEEEGEPGPLARAVGAPAAKEAGFGELVEGGVLGGQYGRVGRDRDDAAQGVRGGDGGDMTTGEEAKTHSCASNTWPVNADTPKYGAAGKLIPWTRKQSVQSSPENTGVRVSPRPPRKETYVQAL